jgi:hypothetical protein
MDIQTKYPKCRAKSSSKNEKTFRMQETVDRIQNGEKQKQERGLA